MSQHLISQLFQIVCPDQCLKDPDEMLIQVISQLKHQIAEMNYNALEKQVQKYEGEIRKHIRMEQQIKLYAESLQSKLDEQEQFKADLMTNSKSLINSLKRENQELYEQIKLIQEENKQLRLRLLDRSPEISPSPMHEQHTVKNNIKYTTIDFNPQKKRLSKQNDEISMNHEIKTQISHTIDSSNLRSYHQKQQESKISKSKQSDLRPDPRQFRQYISQQSRTLSQQQKQPIAQQILNKATRQQSIQQDPRFALKSDKVSDYSTIISNTQTQNFIYPKKKTERSEIQNKQGKSISEHQSLIKRSLHMNEHVASQDYTEYLEQDIQ